MLTSKVISKVRTVSVFIIGLFVLGLTGALAQSTVPRDAVVDFDGDGRTDLSVMRPAANAPGAQYTWWTQLSGSGEIVTLALGLRAYDVPVPADYDGDGRDDMAMFRTRATLAGNDAGNWYIFQSSTNTFRIERFGITGDNATVVDDYDGDGVDDLAVFRINQAAQGPGQAYFYYKGSANNPQGNITYVPWGMRYGTQSEQADDPYTGDFDGDGKADFGVQRHADTNNTTGNFPAVFHILTSTGQVIYQYFGLKSDRVIPGDYDGDGKTDIAVARDFNIGQTPPLPIKWFIRYSDGRADERFEFGTGINFNFAQGDYDGDGKTDIAMLVNGPQSYFWVRSAASGAVTAYPWGTTGDLPVAGYNNR